MKRIAYPAAVATAIVLATGVIASAAEVTVSTVDQLRNALYAASPGDRIYVAPGSYNSRLWVSGVHGTAGNLIEVVAQDPTNRPVFTSDSASCFTLNDSSYIMVDGIIAEHGGTPTQDSNNIELPNSSHMIIRNSLSRWIDHQGNSDAFKFASSDNILAYNCTADTWAEGGSAFDIMNNHNSLFMRNTITYPTLPDYAGANGFQPKGDYAYESGFYKNYFYDGSSRAQQFGGAGGSAGWEAYDMVAVGNVFDLGEAPLAYVSCTTSEFSYNTIVNPEKWVMRILKEGIYEPAYNTFKRNLVYYGMLSSIQNIGSGTQPETFNYEANYWYNSISPGASIPSLPGGETDPAGGTDPQLGTDYRPRYGPAKEYGAHAEAMEAEFAQHQGWFQWAWDKSQIYEPDAVPGGSYQVGTGGTVGLDASGSYAGAGAYDDDLAHPDWHHRITDWQWDLDYDGDFDDASGENPYVSHDYLTGTLGLAPGVHTIELRISVSTPYGTMVEYARTQLEILDEPGPPPPPTPPPTPPAAPEPYVDWAYKYLGDGKYGVTFTVRGNDGEPASFFARATFEGVNGGEVQQVQALGSFNVDNETDADSWDGLGEPPYDKDADSWFGDPFAKSPPASIVALTEAENYYHIEAGTGGGSQYEDAKLAYIVTTGDVSYFGVISRSALNWDFSSVLVVAPPGDANYDGSVDGADYTLWADNYQASGVGWGGGDFNGDDTTDGADYTIWADFYTGGGTPVPEPATLAVLGIGLLAAVRRRRR